MAYPTLYYVDPTSGSDVTGDGTSGTPWKTVQKALDTITRDATNGDQINVKAGGTDTLSASLDFTTYGTPASGAPIVIRGYTTTAGDGGIGLIAGGGNKIVTGDTIDSLIFIDMHLSGGQAANYLLSLDNTCGLINCEIEGCVDADDQFYAHGCYFHNTTNTAYILNARSQSVFLGNFLDGTDGTEPTTAYITDNGGYSVNNIVRMKTNTAAVGIQATIGAIGNSVFCASGGTGTGINTTSAVVTVIANNVVEGMSGTGGTGIKTNTDAGMISGNAVYNCATAYSLGTDVLVSANNDTLAASPFVAGGTGDFDINGTVTGVTEDAYPSAFLGLASTTPKADKGAVQAGAGTSGGTTNLLRGKLG